MVQSIAKPDPRELLSPLLACLPTAFASPRPPPALLPLLTPILRQRVHLLSQSNPASDSWLPLLCWDREAASKLPATVERISIEPHPVSGEVEFEDVEEVQYRRLDAETLHCRFLAKEFGLLPIYLWCLGDGQGGGNGWRLAELKTLDDMEDGTEWYESMQEADQSVSSGRPAPANGVKGRAEEKAEPDDDDDSAYWAAYDRTPGRTPQKRSPAPVHKPSGSVQMPTASELQYFARYMSEVQPAMDPHDPSESGVAPGESTLNGNALSEGPRKAEGGTIEPVEPALNGHDHPAKLEDTSDAAFVAARDEAIHHPRPSSSSSSRSVDRLEQQAASHSQAEVGIKQHISTDIKSLYRLAKSAGIDQEEFKRIVSTELEMLTLLDME